MADIAVVGSGLMGTATVYPLSDNGCRVRLVGTHLDTEIIQCCKEQNFHPRLRRELPPGVRPYFSQELGEALDGVEVIVCGVNSLGIHWIAEALSPHIREGQKIIAVTKGLEVDANGGLVILPDVLRAGLPAAVRDKIGYAAIGGPCIAGELAGRRQSCIVFGSRQQDLVESLAAIFRTSYYHIWTTTDLVGLEISAALKNAYALAVGLASGLLEKAGGKDTAGAGMYNLAASVFAQSIIEISRMLELTHANHSFGACLPGAGDLYVTSVGGRTIRLGQLLGAGHSYAEARQIMAGETLESAEIIRVMSIALPELERAGSLKAGELPLMRRLIEIVVQGAPVEFPLDGFMGGQGWI